LPIAPAKIRDKKICVDFSLGKILFKKAQIKTIVITATKETHIKIEPLPENIPKARPLLQTRLIWKIFLITAIESPGWRFVKIICLASWSIISSSRITRRADIILKGFL
jgi:hypothetical protein